MNKEISPKRWLLIGIMSVVLLTLILLFMIITSVSLSDDRVELKIKEELLEEESIIEKYDEILKVSLTRDYSIKPDEDLPNNVHYVFCNITILATIWCEDGDVVVEHKYIASVFYEMRWSGKIFREPYILDCDFARVIKEVE